MPSILPMVAAPENLPAPSPSSPPRSAFSVFSTESDKTPTVDVPLSVINRILPSELDEIKVAQFMEDIQAGDSFTPMEILRVALPDGRRFYFALGGCHRYEAHKRLGSETLRGRVINVPPSALRLYLGAGCPF